MRRDVSRMIEDIVKLRRIPCDLLCDPDFGRAIALPDFVCLSVAEPNAGLRLELQRQDDTVAHRHDAAVIGRGPLLRVHGHHFVDIKLPNPVAAI